MKIKALFLVAVISFCLATSAQNKSTLVCKEYRVCINALVGCNGTNTNCFWSEWSVSL